MSFLNRQAWIWFKRGRMVVPAERIELPTFGLQNRCSTAELNRLTQLNHPSMPRKFRHCLPQSGVDGAGGPSNNRLVLPRLGDLALILKLKLQVLDQLGQPFPRQGIGRLQGQSAGLRQPSIEFFAVSAGHWRLLPSRRTGP